MKVKVLLLACCLPVVMEIQGPASNQVGREVEYMAGTYGQLSPGCRGQLDARDPNEILVVCGGIRVMIPTAKITFSRIVESQKDVRELGLAGTRIAQKKGQDLVYIRTQESNGSTQWILLAMSPMYARNLVVYLIRIQEDRHESSGAPNK